MASEDDIVDNDRWIIVIILLLCAQIAVQGYLWKRSTEEATQCYDEYSEHLRKDIERLEYIEKQWSLKDGK